MAVKKATRVLATGGTLANRFRETVSKMKDPRMKMESQPTVGYSSGFLNFDFANGTVVHVRSEERNYNYFSIGIPDGCLVMLVGRSGCGKTTWAVQAAKNIIKPFDGATIFHDDIEGGLTEYRKEMLSGMKGKQLKDQYLSRNTGITAENFYERVKMIHDMKITGYDEFTYDTGYFDSNGERIYKLIPTPYILDSVALLMPEKYTQEEELSGSMSSTAAAKTNSMSFKRIQPMLKAANIILFLINHVNKNIDIGMVKSRSQVGYFKQEETVPGGNTIIYLTNLLIKFEDREKLVSDKEYGIDGFVVDATFIKSRNSRAGQTIPLVFDQQLGFDAELSLYLMLKNAEVITGSGAYFSIKGTDIKFTQRGFKEKLKDPTFAQLFMNTCLEYMKNVLNTSDTYITNSGNVESIIDQMVDMINEPMAA